MTTEHKSVVGATSAPQLWSAEVEQKFIIEDSMLATIYCKKDCGFSEKSFFRGKSRNCPDCDGSLAVDTLNSRNAVVGAKTETFAKNILSSALKELRPQLSQDLFVRQGVICPSLGLKGGSGADLAIVTQEKGGPMPASAIKCLFEVKMSFIWNWHEENLTSPTADYDSHFGRPSIFRTDSILKAIGKAGITRSYVGSEGIPFIVVGNTPPPPGYRTNIDRTVSSGLIQKWISLTPNPLVVKPKESPGKRNPKHTTGFLRIDEVKELQLLLKTLLTQKWLYTSAMADAAKVGLLIKSLDMDGTPEQIGQEFLRRLPEASISSEI